MSTSYRSRAILGFDRKIVSELLAGSQGVYAGMSANAATFPAPVPALSVLAGQSAAVAAAQATVETRVRGASTTRNARRASLVTTLEQLVAYVQGVADVAPVDSAPMIIESAGMKVAAVGKHQKPPLAAKAGPPGTVLLAANAGLLSKGSSKVRLFTWEHTLDGGKTFLTTLAPTPAARTSLTGLASLASVGFRVAITLAEEAQGDWTQVVYITVP